MIVYLDANIVIYLVEQHPTFGPKARSRVNTLRAAGHEIAVSDAARMECLVLPYRNGDVALLGTYASFFNDPDMKVFPLTPPVCERTAQIHGLHRFKIPDSIHLAAAVEHGCGLFLTADAQLVRFPDLPVEILS